MKNKVKIILSIFVLLSISYIVKRNSISKSGVELIASIEMEEILQDYNNKLKAELNGNEYKTEFLYNYYTSSYGKDICNDVEKLKKVVTVNVEKEYWFIY